MTKKLSYAALEKLGRERLSPNFFFRDFLYSEIANYHGIPNLPHPPACLSSRMRGTAGPRCQGGLLLQSCVSEA